MLNLTIEILEDGCGYILLYENYEKELDALSQTIKVRDSGRAAFSAGSLGRMLKDVILFLKYPDGTIASIAGDIHKIAKSEVTICKLEGGDNGFLVTKKSYWAEKSSELNEVNRICFSEGARDEVLKYISGSLAISKLIVEIPNEEPIEFGWNLKEVL